MVKTNFVGYRHVKYVNKAGKPVEGYTLYFTEERDSVEGLACFDSWVGVDTFINMFSCVPLGSAVELTYNRYGSVSGCHIVY